MRLQKRIRSRSDWRKQRKKLFTSEMELLRSHLIQVFHSIRSLSTILENDLRLRITVAGSQRLSSKRFMITKEENISCMSITAMDISNISLLAMIRKYHLMHWMKQETCRIWHSQHTRKAKMERLSNVANICSLYRLCSLNLENGIVEVRASLIVRLMRSMPLTKRSANGWMHCDPDEAKSIFQNAFYQEIQKQV